MLDHQLSRAQKSDKLVDHKNALFHTLPILQR